MKAVIRLVWLMVVGLLVVPPNRPVYAVAPNTASADSDAVSAQSVVYLPVVGQGFLLFNDAISAFEPAATSGLFDQAFDATPDPTGNTIYFTATSANGPTIFSVPATGGEVVTVSVGIPLTLPTGLVINPSGETLFVADSEVEIEHDHDTTRSTDETRNSHSEGAIFRLPIGGNRAERMAERVAGTEHTKPHNLEIVQENGTEIIYFTGLDPNDDQPAVMKVTADGGPRTIIAKGAPLVEPAGVTVDTNGVIYVADQGAGSVFRITNGVVETLISGVRLGDPAGIALSFDESLLLVSALEGNRDSSMVLVIDLVKGNQGVVNAVIGANIGSGGLHRAHGSNRFAWCGVTAGGGGVVYRVELR